MEATDFTSAMPVAFGGADIADVRAGLSLPLHLRERSRMKTEVIGIRLTLVLISVMAAASLWARVPGPRRDAEKEKTTSTAQNPRKAINAVLDQQLAAWNRGDLEGFMDGYWHSTDLVYISNKNIYHGWQTILDRYRQVFKSGEVPMGTLELQETVIDLLGRDDALVWGTYSVVTTDGKQRGGLYTLVMRKFPEGWRTIYDRTSSESQ